MKKLVILCLTLFALTLGCWAGAVDSYQPISANQAKAYIPLVERQINQYGVLDSDGYWADDPRSYGICLARTADLNGDSTTELLLGNYVQAGYVEVSVYTYKNGQAVYCGKVGVNFGEGGEIFLSKRGGITYVVVNQMAGGPIIRDEYQIYQLQGNRLNRTMLLQNDYIGYDGSVYEEKYYINGREVSRADFDYYYNLYQTETAVIVGGEYAISTTWDDFAKIKEQNIWYRKSTSPVFVDGKEVTIRGYNIYDNNHYKLRDVAAIINDTGNQFNVLWNEKTETIDLISGESYQKLPSDLQPQLGPVTGEIYRQKATLRCDGQPCFIQGFLIDESHYYKLRDLAALFGFGVSYNEENDGVYLTTQRAEGGVEYRVYSNEAFGFTTPYPKFMKDAQYDDNGATFTDGQNTLQVWGENLEMDEQGVITIYDLYQSYCSQYAGSIMKKNYTGDEKTGSFVLVYRDGGKIKRVYGVGGTGSINFCMLTMSPSSSYDGDAIFEKIQRDFVPGKLDQYC